ncbi:SURF1-like protein [Sphingobium sp. TA15]|uniref:SURF1-like protein n=1 Tax=Sphingobium indicum (strain DSM 16413 / CCM 7287 / MTCC 6362 / UT26 / NBRC 101211 / UT26S) TaxID=452662 RepID=D4Z2V4_SPHIU|nr:SURF1 family protein [Sphingobium indicum]BAI96936.1 Surf1 protein [Sphingobium indicum UT26S]BDD66369.1 SURF1-like protein [Sphingobium sp. TA15]
MTTARDGERSRRSPAFPIGPTLIALLLFAGFCALGAWQVQRLAWKRDLIARVDARIHALPIPAPRAAGRADEYRRARISGHFLHDKAALVQAVTVRGPGFWVLTPLVTDQGFTLIVNRGFVPPDRRRDYARPPGEVHVTGLLRLSEPGGGFLRSNDPAADRWYSRDVAAIAATQRISGPVPDYFIDADAARDPDSLPVGGLTVVKFPNSHLQYAITWFALAAMVAGAYIFVMRQERKDRRG